MEEQNNNKRVLRVELGNDVKKVSITGKNSDEKVVMRQELSEDDLEQATGGYPGNVIEDTIFNCTRNISNNVPDERIRFCPIY